MLRSKSRSGSFDFRQKNHNSVFSRTISASRFCRGDALTSQIDTKAIKSLRRRPSEIVNLSENPIDRVSTMQLQMGDLEKELNRAKERLGAVEEERDRALDELREMKMVAQEANMRLSEELSSRRVEDVFSELDTVKASLSNSERELKIKEKNLEALTQELEKTKMLELRLAEREASLVRLKEELGNVKASDEQAMSLLSESMKRIQELEAEAERGKLSETKMFDTVISQTKQLEQTKIELEESKLEVASLRGKLGELDTSSTQSRGELHESHNVKPTDEAFESLKSELQSTKESLARAQEAEKVALQKVNSLTEETKATKNELKLAIDAEEKSRKAMDDLALALTEVAKEASQVKEKLSSTQMELEHVKEEAEKLKERLRSTEEKYQKLLEEGKKEKERYENTVERLRSEAEESSLAWNEKELGFVSCIKKTEEEKVVVQHENSRLMESLKAAENSTRMSKEENHKLRDILKQALNEANVAKEAAAIARDENSQLKDSLVEKEEALDFLTRENERLRIDEAAANESIKELKWLLSTASAKPKTEEEEEEGVVFKSHVSRFKDHEDGDRRQKAFSFDLHELKILDEHEDTDREFVEEDPEKAEALKGSIFDNVDTPKNEPRTPIALAHHRKAASFMDDVETTNSEELSQDEAPLDDADSDRNSQRKTKALLRRFGDLLIRRRTSSTKKEPATE